MYTEKIQKPEEKKNVTEFAEKVAYELLSLPAADIKDFLGIIKAIVSKEFIGRAEKAKYHAAQTSEELEIVQSI